MLRALPLARGDPALMRMLSCYCCRCLPFAMAAVRVLVAPRLVSAFLPLSGRHRAPSQRAALHSSAPRPGARVALVSARPDSRLCSVPAAWGRPVAPARSALGRVQLPPSLGNFMLGPLPRQCLSSCRCCRAAESMTERRSMRPQRKSSEFVNTPLGLKGRHGQSVIKRNGLAS